MRWNELLVQHLQWSTCCKKKVQMHQTQTHAYLCKHSPPPKNNFQLVQVKLNPHNQRFSDALKEKKICCKRQAVKHKLCSVQPTFEEAGFFPITSCFAWGYYTGLQFSFSCDSNVWFLQYGKIQLTVTWGAILLISNHRTLRNPYNTK